MSVCNKESVRAFILRLYDDRFRAAGLDTTAVPDDLDLLREGIIDSLGFVELITMIEDEFDIVIEFEALDPEDLTILGSVADYIGSNAQAKSAAAAPEGRIAHRKLPTTSLDVPLDSGPNTALETEPRGVAPL